MKLPIAYFGNPILRKKCERVLEITPEIRRFVHDMEETMIAHDGIGLAAPQVQRSLAIFITCVPPEVDGEYTGEPGKLKIFINPKILEYSEEEWIRGEGCLSTPGIYGPVIRPLSIKVEAIDLDGKIFIEDFSGLDARAIMHENDHINGVLFIDRVRGKERLEIEKPLKDLKKKFTK
ncbi:MAG: peptide deformylase [Parachlamydiaceae bacterium]|nr:peptide deformylase [Parachlamydiaceae bacterium]